MKIKILSCAFFIALLLVLSFPPFGYWPLGILAFILFFYYGLTQLPQHSSWKQPALFFGAFSFFVNALGFYWIAYLLHEFATLNWFFSSLLALFFFALLSVISYGTGALLFFLHRKYIENRTEIHPFMWPLILFISVGLWDVLDYRFFPWSPVMCVGVNKTLMATVGIWGTWGWRFLFFSLTLGVARLWQKKSSWLKVSLQSFALLLLYGLFVGGSGNWNMRRLKKLYMERQPVALIQGNVGNYEKKLSKLQVMPTVHNVLRIHQVLIEKIAQHFSEQSSLGIEPWIFWPETSYPSFPLTEKQMGDGLFEWVKLTRGLHLVGAYEKAPTLFAGNTVELEYNSVFLVHESKGYLEHYRKHIRIPFGEYIPLDEEFPNLYKLLPAVNHFGAGNEFTALPHPNPSGPVFVPMICYEILFNSYVRDFLKSVRAQYPGRDLILVNPSNDSWYGPTSEPSQHAHLARWQAASLELPLLRPTNTGYSQIIAPWGELLESGPRDEPAVVFGALPVKATQKRLSAPNEVPKN